MAILEMSGRCFTSKITMITIKDIAKAANVSVGTVSNVLNGRSSVSLAKIKQVEDAIEKLGYKRNLQAARLKKGQSNKIAFISPSMREMPYHHLFETLELLFSQKGYQLDLYLSHNLTEKEQNIIHKIAQENYHAVIAISCLSEAQCYINNLSGCEVCFAYRQPQGASHSFTLEFSTLFDTFAARLKEQNIRKLAVLSEALGYFNETEYRTLQTVLAKHQVETQLIGYRETSYKAVFSHLDELLSFPAVLVPNPDTAEKLLEALQFSSSKRPLIYRFCANGTPEDHRFENIYLDYDQLAFQLVQHLFGDDQRFATQHHAFSDKKLRSQSVKSIDILAVQSPSIKALEKLIPHFTALTGTEVNIHITSFQQLPDKLAENLNKPQFDLVRIDMESLPYFAETHFSPLTFISQQTLTQTFSQNIVQRFSVCKEQVFAIPFDPSIQMLFYRKDLFDDPKIRRRYYDNYKTELSVPTDFAEFNRIAEFFAQNWENNPCRAGTSLIVDDIEVLASEFLMRYYALVPSLFSQATLTLEAKAAESVLKNIKQLRTASITLEKSWWRESVQQFADGNIPMLIVYMNHFAYFYEKPFNFTIDFAPVPSNMPLLGGGSLAIAKNSAKQTACEQFLHWFLDPFVHQQYIRLGGISSKVGGLPLTEMASTAPYLSFAENGFLHGIRENQATDGKPVNLRQIEKIIGKYVKSYLEQEQSEKDVLSALNGELSQRVQI